MSDDRRKARARRAALGKQNAQVRKLKSVIEGLEHRLDSKDAELRTAKADAARADQIALDLSERIVKMRDRKPPLTEAESLSLTALALLETAPPTPMRATIRERLVDELTYRGVLPPLDEEPS